MHSIDAPICQHVVAIMHRYTTLFIPTATLIRTCAALVNCSIGALVHWCTPVLLN